MKDTEIDRTRHSQPKFRPIEPGIRPVCDALNTIPGIITLWSCEGHSWTRPPFVTFKASIDVAFKIHKLLGYGHGDGRLKYCWWVRANFLEDGTLQFTLLPNDWRFTEDYRRGLSGRILSFIFRKFINQELYQLASLL